VAIISIFPQVVVFSPDNHCFEIMSVKMEEIARKVLWMSKANLDEEHLISNHDLLNRNVNKGMNRNINTVVQEI
jgi:hypothetical protein